MDFKYIEIRKSEFVATTLIITALLKGTVSVIHANKVMPDSQRFP